VSKPFFDAVEERGTVTVLEHQGLLGVRWGELRGEARNLE